MLPSSASQRNPLPLNIFWLGALCRHAWHGPNGRSERECGGTSVSFLGRAVDLVCRWHDEVLSLCQIAVLSKHIQAHTTDSRQKRSHWFSRRVARDSPHSRTSTLSQLSSPSPGMFYFIVIWVAFLHVPGRLLQRPKTLQVSRCKPSAHLQSRRSMRDVGTNQNSLRLD